LLANVESETMSEPISPDPPAPIGPPRSDWDGLREAWNAATVATRQRLLTLIGCKFTTREVTVVAVNLGCLDRNVGE